MSSFRSVKTMFAIRPRSISPSSPRTRSPQRPTIAARTSSSSRRSRWTISSLDHVADVVRVDHLLPRVGLCLLEAEGDPLALPVDVQHLHLHLLADVED